MYPDEDNQGEARAESVDAETNQDLAASSTHLGPSPNLEYVLADRDRFRRFASLIWVTLGIVMISLVALAALGDLQLLLMNFVLTTATTVAITALRAFLQKRKDEN